MDEKVQISAMDSKKQKLNLSLKSSLTVWMMTLTIDTFLIYIFDLFLNNIINNLCVIYSLIVVISLWRESRLGIPELKINKLILISSSTLFLNIVTIVYCVLSRIVNSEEYFERTFLKGKTSIIILEDIPVMFNLFLISFILYSIINLSSAYLFIFYLMKYKKINHSENIFYIPAKRSPDSNSLCASIDPSEIEN
jgi:hypothetical protein